MTSQPVCEEGAERRPLSFLLNPNSFSGEEASSLATGERYQFYLVVPVCSNNCAAEPASFVPLLRNAAMMSRSSMLTQRL